ncbi:MAG: hypothetical protein ACOYKB_07315 [Succiniclasticum sp.]|jgi:hypothetical protein
MKHTISGKVLAAALCVTAGLAGLVPYGPASPAEAATRRTTTGTTAKTATDTTDGTTRTYRRYTLRRSTAPDSAAREDTAAATPKSGAEDAASQKSAAPDSTTWRPTANTPTLAAPQGPIGYTEAEIKAQLNKQYQQPLPKFRTVSGASADQNYRPGSTDVKIPALFFPPVVAKPVSASYRINPDGTYGLRPEYAAQRKAYEDAQAAWQQQAAATRQGGAAAAKKTAPAKKSAATDHYKAITGWINVPAPSPFRAFTTASFRYITNPDGGYNVPVLRMYSADPMKGLPQSGPMMLREASNYSFMAATVDDPSDTYHYKNKGTFPTLSNASPIFTETRQSVEGLDTEVAYYRYYVSGMKCLAVVSAMKSGEKTYRLFQIFPESYEYTYLPQVLYAVENLHTSSSLLHPTYRYGKTATTGTGRSFRK